MPTENPRELANTRRGCSPLLPPSGTNPLPHEPSDGDDDTSVHRDNVRARALWSDAEEARVHAEVRTDDAACGCGGNGGGVFEERDGLGLDDSAEALGEGHREVLRDGLSMPRSRAEDLHFGCKRSLELASLRIPLLSFVLKPAGELRVVLAERSDFGPEVGGFRAHRAELLTHQPLDVQTWVANKDLS